MGSKKTFNRRNNDGTIEIHFDLEPSSGDKNKRPESIIRVRHKYLLFIIYTGVVNIIIPLNPNSYYFYGCSRGVNNYTKVQFSVVI